MELKIACRCGQKYKFDVEPVNGQMPFAVQCPVCGADGTVEANAALGQLPSVAAAAVSPVARLRVAAEPAAPPPIAAPPVVSRPLPVPLGAAVPNVAAGAGSLPLGALGALLGAGVGMGAMYGFFMLTSFRFPLLGVGIGFLCGLGARLLYKGTDSSLGGISAAIAGVAVFGTLYLMYGTFPLLNIISLVVSVSVAYRTASG